MIKFSNWSRTGQELVLIVSSVGTSTMSLIRSPASLAIQMASSLLALVLLHPLTSMVAVNRSLYILHVEKLTMLSSGVLCLSDRQYTRLLLPRQCGWSTIKDCLSDLSSGCNGIVLAPT